jgi:hypothetical protein
MTTTTLCTRCGRRLTEATTYLSRDSRPYCSRDLDRLPSYLRRPTSKAGGGWPFPSETPPDAA